MNKNPPKVSIVINSYKDLDKLKSCLNAISKARYNNKEVIVVSYGISEKAIKTSEINSSINKLILTEKDLGPPAQRNVGFKARDRLSKYVLFVDDDVLIMELAIENLIRVLEKFPYIGVAQPLLVTSDQLIDCAGAFIDPLGYTYLPFFGKHISFLNIKSEYIKSSYGQSACLILKASLFSDDKYFQPFDDEFYFNYEDVDLCLRSWIRGIVVVCVPSAIVIHDRSRTAVIKRQPNHLIYLNTRNKFITLTSILNIKTLLIYLPLFIIFESARAIYLLRIHSTHTLSIFRAILWCLRNLGKIWLRRRFVMKTAIKRNMRPKVIKTNFLNLIRGFKFHYD